MGIFSKATTADRVILAVVLSCWTSASAADEVDAAAYMPQWSGFYLGALAGSARGSSFHDITGSATDRLVEMDGAFGGVSAEYLWQNGNFVFGPQAELAWSSVDGTLWPSTTNRFTGEVDWFGSVGGKAGLAFDDLLVFGTAGFALADITAGRSNTLLSRSYSENQMNTGYSVGAGLDLMLRDGWVLGAEYRYYDFTPTDYFTGSSAGFQARTLDNEFHAISFRLRKKLY